MKDKEGIMPEITEKRKRNAADAVDEARKRLCPATFHQLSFTIAECAAITSLSYQEVTLLINVGTLKEKDGDFVDLGTRGKRLIRITRRGLERLTLWKFPAESKVDIVALGAEVLRQAKMREML
jgi:hypothetical protein